MHHPQMKSKVLTCNLGLFRSIFCSTSRRGCDHELHCTLALGSVCQYSERNSLDGLIGRGEGSPKDDVRILGFRS